MKRKILRFGLAGVLAAVLVAVAATPASAANLGSYLRRDGTSGTAPTTLYVNDYIQRTSNGYYYWLILQSDGNLVLYKGNSSHVASKVCWASGTNGYTSGRAIYQGDGNFVIYSPLLNVAIWGSNTVGHSGTTVDINSAGRLYIGNTPISSSC